MNDVLRWGCRVAVTIGHPLRWVGRGAVKAVALVLRVQVALGLHEGYRGRRP